MSQTKKTYTLGKIKQLIDLNGDSTNFDLTFKVTCQDDTPFNLLVVDQVTLDNTPELQYKEAHGTISGNIVADKNVYQNYFLILKSEKQCLVDVELTKKILPKTPSEPINSAPSSLAKPRRSVTSPPTSKVNWTKIGLISVVIIVGLGVLWWMYKRKGKPADKSGDAIPDDGHTYKMGAGSTGAGVLGGVVGVGADVSSHKKVSPAQSSSGDNRGYKPSQHKQSKPAIISPDVISQESRQSSARSDAGGNSLLNRLRKFAR